MYIASAHVLSGSGETLLLARPRVAFLLGAGARTGTCPRAYIMPALLGASHAFPAQGLNGRAAEGLGQAQRAARPGRLLRGFPYVWVPDPT